MSLRLSGRLDPTESTNDERGLLLEAPENPDAEHLIDVKKEKSVASGHQ